MTAPPSDTQLRAERAGLIRFLKTNIKSAARRQAAAERVMAIDKLLR